MMLRTENKMRKNTRSMFSGVTAATSAVKDEEQLETGCLDFISLPIIRLEEFDQDELQLLAEYSGNFPEAGFQNIVIPKIDRQFFNESVGSRRQTYGKCFASRHWNTVPDNADDTDNDTDNDTGNEEDSEPLRSRSRGRLRKKQKQQRKVTLPEKTRSAKAVARVIVERKGRFRSRDTSRGTGVRKLSWIRKKRRPSDTLDSSDDAEWTDSAEKVGRGAGSTKRGRPKKLVSGETKPSNEDRTPHGLTENSRKKQKQEVASLVEEDYEKELGRRTRKRRASENCSVDSGVLENARPERGVILGRHGEIDRKDGGGRTYFGEEELMETLRKMKGKWSSSQMKRKIVDATGFPKGWTVMVGLRHTKDGRAYFDYRNWRSPEGKIWTSYKEAAVHMISNVGKDSCYKGLSHSSAGEEDGSKPAGQEDGCKQAALMADGETSHEDLSSDRDQIFNNNNRVITTLINTHDDEIIFETPTEGGIQSQEQSLHQDLQDVECGACEATIGNPYFSGDGVDKFLRVSRRTDNVAISTETFGGQVMIKMDPSTCGAYREGTRSLLISDGNLKRWQSDCEFQDLIVSSLNGSETKPEECQSAQKLDDTKIRRESDDDSLKNELDGRCNVKAQEIDGSKIRREADDDLLENESDGRGNSKHLSNVQTVIRGDSKPQEIVDSKIRRESDDYLLKCEPDGRGNSKHLSNVQTVIRGNSKAQEIEDSKIRRESEDYLLKCEPDGRGNSKQLSNLEHGHVCHLCGMSFPTFIKLRRHLKRSKHVKCLNCEVCGKKFTSITHLLSHRLKMVHPRTSKENLHLTRFPAEVSDLVGKSNQSDMSNIVLGLLSDVHRIDGGWESDQPSVLKQSINRPTDTARGAGKYMPHMLESVKGEVGEVPPSELPNVVFECGFCHKIFHHQSKFWGHLSVHSSKKGGMRLAAPKSSKIPRTLPIPDGVYECDICHKIFHHQSKYWGHLSIHSNKRKKVPTSSILHDPESERLGSSMVEELKPSVRELDSGSNGVEVIHTACVKQHVTESVFWKLLDDSIPSEGVNHEPVPYREEATTRPLAPCTKEEAVNDETNNDFRAPLNVNFGQTSGLPQAKSSSSVLSIHSDSLRDHGLLEQRVGETQKIISDAPMGIESIWKHLSEKPPPIYQENEACPVCRKDDDQPRHLICDWCEKEFHQGCLSPVLHEVPVSWICPFCRTRDTHTF